MAKDLWLTKPEQIERAITLLHTDTGWDEGMRILVRLVGRRRPESLPIARVPFAEIHRMAFGRAASAKESGSEG